MMLPHSPLRILITGCEGQVGWELQRTLLPLGNVTAVSRKEMDLSSADSIRDCIRSLQPNLVVNAAAYTAVDKAESEPALAQSVNADAVAVMADEARKIGAALIHYSTDYVFDGTKTTPYVESDPTHPLSVYGKTKLAGEQALTHAEIPHLILRTSWVYGARGKNFLRTILKLAAEKPELRIVSDQTGAPTSSREIATATALLVQRWFVHDMAVLSGIYHLTATGETTWHGFAAEALRLRAIAHPAEALKQARLIAIPTSEYPTPATRPMNSRLDCSRLEKIFDVRLPDWKISLASVLQEIRHGSGAHI